MKKMSSREKFILVTGLILFGCYGIFEFAIQPVWQKQKRANESIESKMLFISRYYSILSQKDYYLKKEEATRTLAAELEQRFLNQEKPALAGADLQRILQTLAGQNSVHIVQVNTEKPKFTVGILTVPVRVTVRCSLRNLSDFLRSIENHQKFLVVEDLQSRRINRNEPEYLETRLVVDGFLKQRQPEQDKKA